MLEQGEFQFASALPMVLPQLRAFTSTQSLMLQPSKQVHLTCEGTVQHKLSHMHMHPCSETLAIKIVASWLSADRPTLRHVLSTQAWSPHAQPNTIQAAV
jgi:hypothetical protein